MSDTEKAAENKKHATPDSAVTVTLGSSKNASPLAEGGVQVSVQDVGSTGVLPVKPKPHWQTPRRHRPGCVLSAEPQSEFTMHDRAHTTNKTNKSNIMTMKR